jgi:L-arabinose isomerase
VPHHWALGIGHRVAELKSVAELLDIEMVVV